MSKDWMLLVFGIASVIAIVFHSVLYITILSLAGGIIASYIIARRDIKDMKVLPISPLDQLEIQRLIDNGLYKEAVMLALERAYGITEKDLYKMKPQDINILLLKLSKEIERERQKQQPTVL